MKKFYFDTGVKPSNVIDFAYDFYTPQNGYEIRNTVVIPFECEDVPEGAKFMFGCNIPDLPESKNINVIVREIHSKRMYSKYAYFELKEKR